MQLLINKKNKYYWKSWQKSSINKVKSLVDYILICLFCTDLKLDDGSTWRTMLVIIVCDQGNIWFFSENSSDENKAIATQQILLKKKVFRNRK